MPYMHNDFGCKKCGHEFEEMWNKPVGDNEEAWNAWKKQVRCPECNSSRLKKLVSAPGVAEFSIKDKAGRTASLKKRSLEHSKKKMRREMDKHRATITRKIDAIKG